MSIVESTNISSQTIYTALLVYAIVIVVCIVLGCMADEEGLFVVGFLGGAFVSLFVGCYVEMNNPKEYYVTVENTKSIEQYNDEIKTIVGDYEIIEIENGVYTIREII